MLKKIKVKLSTNVSPVVLIDVVKLSEAAADLRVEGELRHDGAELGEVAVVVERREVVEQLERAHQRLRRRRVHEVEVHQVVDAQLLQLRRRE